MRSTLGWRERGSPPATASCPVDPAVAPPSTSLGVLGMPAFTAWIGLDEIAGITAGETVFVSGAAGAVGSAAVQIALLRGCRVLGSAGSEEKVEWLRSLGVEAFDYRTADLREALRPASTCTSTTSGASQFEAALTALRTHGRVVACGAISRYNAVAAEPGPRNFFLVVTKRLRIQGFIIFDHNERFPEFAAEMGAWLRDGKLAYRETIVDGFENLPTGVRGPVPRRQRRQDARPRRPDDSRLTLKLDHGRAQQALAGDREHAVARVGRRWNGNRPLPRRQAGERLLSGPVARRA